MIRHRDQGLRVGGKYYGVPSRRQRKIAGNKSCAIAAQHHGLFDCVLQLTDIALPIMRAQALQRFRGDLLDGNLFVAAALLDKMQDQQPDVGAALAQRRDVSRNDVQPIVEILSKLAFLDHRGQIAVSGGDHAQVHVDGFRAAQALEFALLKDT